MYLWYVSYVMHVFMLCISCMYACMLSMYVIYICTEIIFCPTHTHTHTHTYIHACMHAYIHTHIHTYIYTTQTTFNSPTSQQKSFLRLTSLAPTNLQPIFRLAPGFETTFTNTVLQTASLSRKRSRERRCAAQRSL